MRWLTIDAIVRSVLLKEGKPIHYYLERLVHACAGLKLLHTHSLKSINAKKLPVNSYKAVTLPCDYVDYVRVGIPIGERVRELILDTSLNRLHNFDGNTKVPYENVLPDGTSYSEWDHASPYGGYEDATYNHRVDRQEWRFNVLPERGEIQLSADYPFDCIILDYITDGLEADNATRVDPLAQNALEKYILWQVVEHKRGSGLGEIREAERRFHDAHRLLRAAKNPLTKADIIHAVYSGYSGTYK